MVFVGNMTPPDDSRAAIDRLYRADEAETVASLLELADLGAGTRARVQARARQLVEGIRETGVEESDLPRLAENCMLDDWTFSNPRKIRSPEQVMEILKLAY